MDGNDQEPTRDEPTDRGRSLNPDDDAKKIFDDASELQPEQREAFLEANCRDNLELRHTVASLLRAHDEAGDFLANPTGAAAPDDSAAGQRVGRYKLLERIGEGGFGTVYMAEQETPVRRRVAMKIIKLGMDTKAVIARFEAERQALAMMDHPNIARVFDAGATDMGRPYFVMELIKGIPITAYCDQKELATRDRLQLFICVCSAVQHAHQKGVIHRDLKPNNVLVSLHDDKPVVKIIDFGVAKATQSKLTERTLFTGFRQMIGTPAYMSPEQAQLSALDVDTRSDIYSLGVLLYELLTSTTPFDSKLLLSAAYDEMQRIIREVDPPSPSTRLSRLDANTLGNVAHQRQHDPKRLAQFLKGDLDVIVMKCLEKDRTRRYATANSLAEDTQRYLSDEPVQARRPTGIYRIRKFARRNKVAVAACGAVTMALILGFGIATWMFLRERQASSRALVAEQVQIQLRRQAEADKEKADTEAIKSQQVAQLLKDMLNGVGPYVAMGRDTTLLRDIVDRTSERIGMDLKDQPEVEAELLDTIGYVYSEIGPVDKAEAMLRRSLALRRALPGDHRLEVASSLHGLGLALWRQNRMLESELAFREALAMRRELPDARRDLPMSLENLGAVLTWEGQLAEAESLEREAVQLRKNLNDEWGAVWPLNFLSQVLGMEGKLAEAEATARESVAISRRASGDAQPTLAQSLQFLGYALHRAGKLTEAETVLREALTEIRKVSDKERSLTLAWILDELARVISEQNRPDEAEVLLRESLEIKKNVLGIANTETNGTLRSLIVVLRQEGRLDEAEKLGRQIPVATTRPSPTTPLQP